MSDQEKPLEPSSSEPKDRPESAPVSESESAAAVSSKKPGFHEEVTLASGDVPEDVKVAVSEAAKELEAATERKKDSIPPVSGARAVSESHRPDAPDLSLDGHRHSDHGHRHSDHGSHIGHVAPLGILLGVLGALIILTVMTVAVTAVDLGSQGNFIVAMVIATVKAALVMGYFMHLVWDSKFNVLAFLSSFLFVLLFLSMAVLDRQEYQSSMDAFDQKKATTAK